MSLPLPPFRKPSLQRTLFDVDEYVRVTPASSRNWVGEFFEEATAVVSGGQRLTTRATNRVCPDIVWTLSEQSQVFFEVKAVGKSGHAIIYEGRLAKDLRFSQHYGYELFYWFWRHAWDVAASQNRRELYDGVAASAQELLILDLHSVAACCRQRPIKVLNTGYTASGKRRLYGDSKHGYGEGWSLPWALLKAACRPAPSVGWQQVYQRPLARVDVFVVHDYYRNLVSMQQNTMGVKDEVEQRKYLYAFEAAVLRLITEYYWSVAEPCAMYGEQGLVSRFFGKHPGHITGLWVNAHAYAHSKLSPEQGADNWVRECCLPIIKKERGVPEQKKLRESFNLFPDGDETTLVVGVGFAEYKVGKCPAVFLIFADGKGKPLSLDVPEHQAELEPGHFFLADWGMHQPTAERVEKMGLVKLSRHPRVQVGHLAIAQAIVDPAKLCDFTAEERQKYIP